MTTVLPSKQASSSKASSKSVSSKSEKQPGAFSTFVKGVLDKPLAS